MGENPFATMFTAQQQQIDQILRVLADRIWDTKTPESSNLDFSEQNLLVFLH